MKLIFLLLLCSSLHAQTFKITPVINEKCDTVTYLTTSETFTVYLLKDGSAWVQSKAVVEYLSKSYFRRWKRKHIKI